MFLGFTAVLRAFFESVAGVSPAWTSPRNAVGDGQRYYLISEGAIRLGLSRILWTVLVIGTARVLAS